MTRICVFLLVGFWCAFSIADDKPREYRVYQNQYQASSASANSLVAAQVNINSADIDQLTQLKGVGIKKAEAIIEWRKRYGGFKSVDDLVQVKGIGQVILESNRARLTVAN